MRKKYLVISCRIAAALCRWLKSSEISIGILKASQKYCRWKSTVLTRLNVLWKRSAMDTALVFSINEKRQLWVRPMGDWNKTLPAVWYVRPVHWVHLCYYIITLVMLWCLRIKSTIWLVQFHTLSLIMFDVSMYKRTVVNFRPGENPIIIAAMMVHILFWVGWVEFDWEFVWVCSVFVCNYPFSRNRDAMTRYMFVGWLDGSVYQVWSMWGVDEIN